MLNTILGYFSFDIGIDLGTANTLVAVKDKGIIIDEPSVVALNTKTKELLAVGEEAKEMVGKTPSNIIAVRPLRNGVISDLEGAEKMLGYFIRKIHKVPGEFPKIPRPRAVIGIPSGITEVEQRAVIKAAKSAGCRRVYLIEEPMAAAIGIGIKVESPEGNMVVDIGGGTTEIAVISLGGQVLSKSLRVGGDKMDEAVINYVKNRFNVLLGERKAEQAKLAVGDVFETPSSKKDSDLKKEDKEIFEVRGRNLRTGLPEVVKLSDIDLRHALKESIDLIIESIKITLEDTPPELVSDILENGIYLAGGGAKLKGLDKVISEKTGIPVNKEKDCELAVVKGTLNLLDDIKLLEMVKLG